MVAAILKSCFKFKIVTANSKLMTSPKFHGSKFKMFLQTNHVRSLLVGSCHVAKNIGVWAAAGRWGHRRRDQTLDDHDNVTCLFKIN